MVIDVPTVRGEWNDLCALARRRWTQLTENDLRVQQGNVEALLDRIQLETCDKREVIENYFFEMTSRDSSAVAHAAEAAG